MSSFDEKIFLCGEEAEELSRSFEKKKEKKIRGSQKPFCFE